MEGTIDEGLGQWNQMKLELCLGLVLVTTDAPEMPTIVVQIADWTVTVTAPHGTARGLEDGQGRV